MTKKYNAILNQLVEILNDGHYHDGPSLGKQLKLTRSAVWKIIKKLQAYGIPIQSIKGKGYVLLQPLILLAPHKIKLDDAADLTVFETISSTNDYLKTVRLNKKIHVCVAEEQTKGKGRWNRDWHSPFGKNIYFSCLYSFQKDVSELAGLSLVTGLAIYHTLKSYGVDEQLSVKWPNDILYAQQKISGSLIEIQAETHGESQVIIGIGINVNMQRETHPHLSQPYTSLREILGKDLNRNEIVSRLLAHLLHYLQEFNTRGLFPFATEWMQSDCLMQQKIALRMPHDTIRGQVKGINEQGHLLLQLTDGSLQAFSAGEVTIEK